MSRFLFQLYEAYVCHVKVDSVASELTLGYHTLNTIYADVTFDHSVTSIVCILGEVLASLTHKKDEKGMLSISMAITDTFRL